MHEGHEEPVPAREAAASGVMDLLTSLSFGPHWVRLAVAAVIIPFAIVFDCGVLICSRRATCCCFCVISLALLLWMITFHLVGSYMESHGPLMVSHDGVLLAAPTPVSTRILSAGLGPETLRTVQAVITILVAALRIFARSASILVSILEWIAGLP